MVDLVGVVFFELAVGVAGDALKDNGIDTVDETRDGDDDLLLDGGGSVVPHIPDKPMANRNNKSSFFAFIHVKFWGDLNAKVSPKAPCKNSFTN
jgi:hypothetical protein